MRIGDIAVAVIWIAFLAGAISAGIKVGYAMSSLGSSAPFPPANVAIFMLLFFFVGSSAGTFFMRRNQLRTSWTGRLIDKVWGQGTSTTIIVRLKPIALMMASCCTCGFVDLASTHAGVRSWTAYFNSAFALSVGSGLVVAYLLSRKYPPTLL
jgi:xanthosine utilization system XapX-like protein